MTTRLLTLSNRRLLHCRTFSNRFLPQSTNHIPNKFRRALSSQTTSTIPKSPIKVLSSPTLEELEKGDFEVEIVPEDQVELTLTDRAAEQLRAISSREGNPDSALRISVESGGCHGYQYKMALSTRRTPGDYHVTHPHVRPSNLHIDAVSLPMINGSTIDFATELIGSSFRVVGNPQAKGGCGCGISWEMKE